ncbi:MAG: NADPH-dependent FMN reductase [Acidimicrobiales bacterium]
MPHFNPDDDQPSVHPAVADLRARISAADALMFSTPEYAGALPGSFKNLLDWTVGGGETYAMPVAWLNASASPTGAADAHACLRRVLERTGTDIVERACRPVPVSRSAIGADGLVTDEDARARSVAALTALAAHAAERRRG